MDTGKRGMVAKRGAIMAFVARGSIVLCTVPIWLSESLKSTDGYVGIVWLAGWLAGAG